MVDLLIIGKNGQLGSALVSMAGIRKISFRAFSRSELDITNFNKSAEVIAKVNPKIVINTSAYHVLSECEKNPNLAFLVNEKAVENLARISKKIKAKFVTYSTNYIFDGKKDMPYFEEDDPNPLQIYGESKLKGEIAAMKEYSAGAYIIRTCAVYGNGKLGSRSKKGNFVLKILEEAEKQDIIYASKKQKVNPTFAIDLARATLELIESKADSGIYHLANEGVVSWYEFARDILLIKNLKNKISEPPTKKLNDYSIPTFSVLENSRARKFGVVLPSVRDGLEEYLKELLGDIIFPLDY